MKILQTGRSMLEMLGVLAIIAVLSIGGLLGYRRAVNNHQANQILDDANRLAFVVMENDRTFENNTVITDDFDFVPTGIYHMDAFLGTTAGQFGIVVTDVPRGVCEALLPKAFVEYTVRVLPDKTADNVQQLSAYGAAYTDSTDICNDINDIALYFGDVSKQCTSISGTKCTTKADCCNGEFCWYPVRAAQAAGTGECKALKNFALTATMSDGNTWTRSSETMNWYSAKNYCEQLGLKMASRSSIGCDGVIGGNVCNSKIYSAIRGKWSMPYYVWLDEANENGSTAYSIKLSVNTMCDALNKNHGPNDRFALCH